MKWFLGITGGLVLAVIGIVTMDHIQNSKKFEQEMETLKKMEQEERELANQIQDLKSRMTDEEYKMNQTMNAVIRLQETVDKKNNKKTNNG